MKRSLWIAALMLLPSLAMADISGVFQTETGENGGHLEVKFGPCANDGAKFCGVIVKAISDNPEAQKLIGVAMVQNMTSEGGGKFSGGTIWAPDNDKTYRSKMELNGNNLKVSGCIGPFCRSQNWRRVQ